MHADYPVTVLLTVLSPVSLLTYGYDLFRSALPRGGIGSVKGHIAMGPTRLGYWCCSAEAEVAEAATHSEHWVKQYSRRCTDARPLQYDAVLVERVGAGA